MKEIINKIGLKKIITSICILVGIIILFIGGALIYNKFFYKKSYNEIEEIMTKATQKYYEKNEKKLPKEEGQTLTIEVKELVKKEYMKPISEYLKDEKIKCSGSINVTNLNKKYRYTPILDCDKDYKTKILTEYIKNNVEIVTDKEGLYEYNNELVYRGELINNYLEFANEIWRIIKISEDKTYIILNNTIKNDTIRMWDNRYNEQKKLRLGINDYKVSRAREYLNEIYKDNKLFSNDDKLLITNYNVYIGKRTPTDEDKSGLTEKKVILENEYIGLLPAYDYINASVDTNCKSLSTKSCNNYNYLIGKEKSWWLGTGNSLNTDEVYKIESGNNITSSKANTGAYLKPVIALAKDTIYVEGNGTKENPYKVK